MRQEGQSVCENQSRPRLNQLMMPFCMINMHSLKIKVHIILILLKKIQTLNKHNSVLLKINNGAYGISL